MPDGARNTSAFVPLELQFFLQWKELGRSRSGSESPPGFLPTGAERKSTFMKWDLAACGGRLTATMGSLSKKNLKQIMWKILKINVSGAVGFLACLFFPPGRRQSGAGAATERLEGPVAARGAVRLRGGGTPGGSALGMPGWVPRGEVPTNAWKNRLFYKYMWM